MEALTVFDVLRAIDGATDALARERDRVDELNVFPVPDGDTGTNMMLTVERMRAEVDAANPNDLTGLGEALTRGALLGARGNSGVILSQIVRGFCEPFAQKTELSPQDLIECYVRAAEVAYRAVRRPVEGTMLTVIREAAAVARKKRRGKGVTLQEVNTEAITAAAIAVERTPELLAVLREAGVVDAGGYGLYVLLEGAHERLFGEQRISIDTGGRPSITAEVVEEITFTYCTEVLVRGSGFDREGIEGSLVPLGDSLLVVGTPEEVRIHIHTDEPGRVLGMATGLGTVHDVKINNMREQAEARGEIDIGREAAAVGMVAVVSGDGLTEIFKSLGVVEIVAGGQSMNPPTSDLVDAIERAPARTVVVLPNNKNVILTAEQAASLVEKTVHVIPTRSIPEGMRAALAFDAQGDPDAVVDEMREAANEVQAGEVTIAVRASTVNGHAIQKGDVIGLIDDRLVATGRDFVEVTLETLAALVTADSSIVSFFFNPDASEEDRERIVERSSELYPQCELEVQDGGQPLYPVLIAVE